MPDPIRKRSVLTASCGHYGQCSQNRAGLCMSDPTFRIRFVSVLPKIARIILCKTDPGPIWMAWSGSGRTDLVCRNPVSKPVCRNYGARFRQNSTGPLPVSHFQTGLRSSTEGPDHTVQNQPGSDLVLADCVRF